MGGYNNTVRIIKSWVRDSYSMPLDPGLEPIGLTMTAPMRIQGLGMGCILTTTRKQKRMQTKIHTHTPCMKS